MPENTQALQAALTKVLRNNSAAAEALADLLKEHGVSMSTQTANVFGDRNILGQASNQSTVTISSAPVDDLQKKASTPPQS